MGKLFIISTPIGNLEDITLRAIKTLFAVDFLACEDTRKTGILLKHYTPILKCIGVKPSKPRLISYYEKNEQQRIPELIKLLSEGKNIGLVSSAGTPTISDPGFKLVRECIKREIGVIPIPGPSSVLAALVVSGLPTDKFLFLGYLPKKKKKKKKFLRQLLSSFKSLREIPTVILYESPHRLLATLKEIKEIFGNIEIVVVKEVTKIHEKIWQGKISQALSHFDKPQGEFTLLIQFP